MISKTTLVCISLVMPHFGKMPETDTSFGLCFFFLVFVEYTHKPFEFTKVGEEQRRIFSQIVNEMP